MITGDLGTSQVVPAHYFEEYPKFVEFMDLYFKFIYRDRGELPKSMLEELSVDEANKRGVGRVMQDQHASQSLEREFVPLLDVDGVPFLDENDRPLYVEKDWEEDINQWYDDLSFDKSQTDADGSVLGNIDDVRLIKLLKDIFAIRGTRHAMTLFFTIFFEVTPTIVYPRMVISKIDDNFVLDGDNTPRDDYYFQEFSYVIQMPITLTESQKGFLAFYKKYFHPAGFQMFVEATP